MALQSTGATLQSMTGFARSDGIYGATSWHWEARAVNGRGLDIRVRVPQGFEMLEQPVREACQKRFVRGNCSISLNVRREGRALELRLNEDVLAEVGRALQRASELCEAAPATLDGILSIKGVMELIEPEESEQDINARNAALIESLDLVLEGLYQARRAEGARLAVVLDEIIDRIAVLVEAAEASPARTPDAIRTRLRDALQRLIGDGSGLDENRLYQEAAMLATKADIEEELRRLQSHIAAGRALIAGQEPAGRRLDFLAQEFNREANTLCSKSNDSDVTKIGLELKVLIDQFREQVQNIE